MMTTDVSQEYQTTAARVMEELERTLPPLSSHPAAATETRVEKGIESPLDIFPSTAPVSEEDIW